MIYAGIDIGKINIKTMVFLNGKLHTAVNQAVGIPNNRLPKLTPKVKNSEL